MAHCERCGTAGFEPNAMFIDLETKMFVGGCCTPLSKAFVPITVSAHPRPPMQVINLPPNGDVEYGMEISNKVGVRAYVNYAGLSVQFEKTPTEIKEWAQKNGLTEPKRSAR